MKRAIILIASLLLFVSCTMDETPIKNHISIKNNYTNYILFEIYETSAGATNRYQMLVPNGYIEKFTDDDTSYTISLYASEGVYYTISGSTVSENEDITHLEDVEITTTLAPSTFEALCPI